MATFESFTLYPADLLGERGGYRIEPKLRADAIAGVEGIEYRVEWSDGTTDTFTEIEPAARRDRPQPRIFFCVGRGPAGLKVGVGVERRALRGLLRIADRSCLGYPGAAGRRTARLSWRSRPVRSRAVTTTQAGPGAVLGGTGRRSVLVPAAATG
jgi:hypothetical protein